MRVCGGPNVSTAISVSIPIRTRSLGPRLRYLGQFDQFALPLIADVS